MHFNIDHDIFIKNFYFNNDHIYFKKSYKKIYINARYFKIILLCIFII